MCLEEDHNIKSIEFFVNDKLKESYRGDKLDVSYEDNSFSGRGAMWVLVNVVFKDPRCALKSADSCLKFPDEAREKASKGFRDLGFSDCDSIYSLVLLDEYPIRIESLLFVKNIHYRLNLLKNMKSILENEFIVVCSNRL